MNRIVTRGLGTGHLLITRGYGLGGIAEALRRVLRLVSKISVDMFRTSKWQKTL